MTEEVDIHVAVIGVTIETALVADLIDKAFQRATTAGDRVNLDLTKHELSSIQYFASTAACSARRLEEAFEAELDRELMEADELSRAADAEFDEAAAVLDGLAPVLRREPANDVRTA